MTMDRDNEAIGRLLRAHAEAEASSARAGLDAMWTRVRAGIAEGGEERRPAARALRRWWWVSVPAAALVVFALVFYPTRLDRSPFNPSSFDVSVEDVESDDAIVALVDKGEDLPRVIWIIEDAKSS